MSLCVLSIVLSLVFAFLLLVFAAQLFYFLWWRNHTRTPPSSSSSSSDIEMGQKSNNNSDPSKGLFHYWVCWKVPRTVHATSGKPELGNNNNNNNGGEEFQGGSVESELMRLHNLAGPPRFLFTIKEETKEELECEDGKSRSLSDLMCAIDTPCSSPFKCSLEFNPLFESSSEEESEFNRFRSSPPPKFKFLRDAEEKLYRRLVEEGRRNTLFGLKDSSSQHVTGSSQVLPLPSSPSTFIPLQTPSSMLH
ncbi:uncharacterized protein LOC107461664 [Arachis duranensis]|uniref:Uncharacterized protein LOC107461664 n=1 Tax=Arachis duranensis TaxID=130453 RepID=A0A6P4BCU4_ARADU|nr:uncharacterized protein LOC107461664 [Arachis duranensis]